MINVQGNTIVIHVALLDSKHAYHIASLFNLTLELDFWLHAFEFGPMCQAWFTLVSIVACDYSTLLKVDQ